MATLGTLRRCLSEDQMNLDVDDRHAEGGAKDKEKRKKRRGGEVTESPKKLKKAKTAAS
jgi:hypothetical protein